MISVGLDFVLFVIWIITGVITVISGFADDEKKVPVLSYIILWIVFLLEMISKMIMIGGIPIWKIM